MRAGLLLQAFDFAEPSRSDSPTSSLQAASATQAPTWSPTWLVDNHQGQLESLASPALLDDSPQPQLSDATWYHAEQAQHRSPTKQSLPVQQDPKPAQESLFPPETLQQQQQHSAAIFKPEEDSRMLGSSCAGQSVLSQRAAAQSHPDETVQSAEAMLAGTASPPRPSLVQQQQQLQGGSLVCPEEDVSSDEESCWDQPEPFVDSAMDNAPSLEDHLRPVLHPHPQTIDSPPSLSLAQLPDPFLAYLQTSEQLSPASSASAAELLHVSTNSDALIPDQWSSAIASDSEDSVVDSAANNHQQNRQQQGWVSQHMQHSFSFHSGISCHQKHAAEQTDGTRPPEAPQHRTATIAGTVANSQQCSDALPDTSSPTTTDSTEQPTVAQQSASADSQDKLVAMPQSSTRMGTALQSSTAADSQTHVAAMPSLARIVTSYQPAARYTGEAVFGGDMAQRQEPFTSTTASGSISDTADEQAAQVRYAMLL